MWLYLAGEYLALTGSAISGAEMLECGLATHFVFAKVCIVSIMPYLHHAWATHITLLFEDSNILICN